jgi:hypothetical protein
MNIATAFSAKPSATEAVVELQGRLSPLDPKLVLYFASSTYDPQVIAREMENAFSPAVVFGCTTAGEIISGRMLKNSIVAMAFNRQVIQDIKVEVLVDIHEQASAAVAQACQSFEAYFGAPMQVLDETKHVGIILVDGLRNAEESLMERIGDLTNVPVIGGSAGDDLKFSCTYVFANGQAYTNAAILALLKPVGEFDFIKTQSLSATSRTLVPTKVDFAKREIIEFDHRPASEAYAAALGISPEQLPDYFMTNPLGLMVGTEPYVRSPQRMEGQHVFFFCAMKEGMKLQILEAADIVEDTRRVLAAKLAELGPVQGLVNFHCILRTLELEKKGQTGAYGQLFADIPTIGFSTYGEEYIAHVNQTSTMLVFK